MAAAFAKQIGVEIAQLCAQSYPAGRLKSFRRPAGYCAFSLSLPFKRRATAALWAIMAA